MAVIRTLPAALAARPVASRVEEPVPGLSLDGFDAAAMLALALAPTAFVMAAALQMLGVSAL